MKYQTALLYALACLPAGLTLAEEPQVLQVEVVVVEAEPVRVIEKQADKPQAEQADTEQTKDGQSKADDDQPSEKELRDKMLELERQLQETRSKFQQQANDLRVQAQKKAAKALDDVKLPENPTRKQCETFIEELREACEGRRSFSTSDPATIKLKQLPPEHFDLLLTEMTNRTSLRYYANYAMREIEPEKLRERFVASLDENPNNIGIIVMHGWCEDVRPAIVNHIKNADSSITPAWFQAAVELDEPSLYPKLHEITIDSRYASQFLNMLEMLPDYDLAHTVNTCWQRSSEGKLAISQSSFAAMAASYGNADALGTLVSQLDYSNNYLGTSSSYNIRRTNILKYIEFRGSNTDIQNWYEANKDKLVFDHFRKRFMVPEEF